MKFILVRHTTTDWNIEDRLQGEADIELNSAGRKQAEGLANKLLNLGISKIISSDLKRSSQTAEIISKKINIPFTLDKRLRECSFGDISGMTKEQVFEKRGHIVLDDRANYDFTPFGGENREQVFSRYNEAFDEYKRKYKGETILIVAHGRGLNTLLAKLGHSKRLIRGEYYIINI